MFLSSMHFPSDRPDLYGSVQPLAKLLEVEGVRYSVSTLQSGVVVHQRPTYSGRHFSSRIHIDTSSRRNQGLKLSSSGLLNMRAEDRDRLVSYTNGFFAANTEHAVKAERIWTTLKLVAVKLLLRTQADVWYGKLRAAYI
jgi:hypothetical protein